MTIPDKKLVFLCLVRKSMPNSDEKYEFAYRKQVGG